MKPHRARTDNAEKWLLAGDMERFGCRFPQVGRALAKDS